MDEAVGTPVAAGPLFRANKRQKVMRQRVEDEGDAFLSAERGHTVGEDGPSAGESIESDDKPGIMRSVRRPGNKKHGIVFSMSQEPRLDERLEQGSSTIEIATLPPGNDQEASHGERFVKQTGRVGVVENKHMLAFVDKKLAEIRSSTPVSGAQQKQPNATSDADETTGNGHEQEGHGPVNEAIQMNSVRASDGNRRNHGTNSRVAKRRNKKGGPDANDLARDSLVDQIMRESEIPIPMYDRSISQPKYDNIEGKDNDEAAAEAFKAQLLADLQQNRRRRAPPTSGAKAGEKTSSGPRLGGSRSQREKMRALEQAKGSGTAK